MNLLRKRLKHFKNSYPNYLTVEQLGQDLRETWQFLATAVIWVPGWECLNG